MDKEKELYINTLIEYGLSDNQIADLFEKHFSQKPKQETANNLGERFLKIAERLNEKLENHDHKLESDDKPNTIKLTAGELVVEIDNTGIYINGNKKVEF